VDRNDLVALTREAEHISGIPYVMDADKDEIDQILGSTIGVVPVSRQA
jgi:hypothetical protein